jgi:hypothetical protein
VISPPHRRVIAHAHHLQQAALGNLIAPVRVRTIRGIRHHDAWRDTRRQRLIDLFQGDLRFGTKLNLRRHASFLPPRRIFCPLFRQIQTMARGKLPCSLAIDRFTATWQLSVFPSRPQYWRATPTECSSFFAKPVSSTIHGQALRFFVSTGSTCEATAARNPASLHSAAATR